MFAPLKVCVSLINDNIINDLSIIINVKRNLQTKRHLYRIRFDAIIILLIMHEYKININNI